MIDVPPEDQRASLSARFDFQCADEMMAIEAGTFSLLHLVPIREAHAGDDFSFAFFRIFQLTRPCCSNALLATAYDSDRFTCAPDTWVIAAPAAAAAGR